MTLSELKILIDACTDDNQAESLQLTLQEILSASPSLGHLASYNPSAHMEDEGAYVTFELNRELSDHYITAIRPEVRDGAFCFVVETSHMRDGLGMNSS